MHVKTGTINSQVHCNIYSTLICQEHNVGVFFSLALGGKKPNFKLSKTVI